MELIGAVKNYDWGTVGCHSAVAQLAALNDDQFAVDARTPYSELWMGDHLSGPATVKGTGERLAKASTGSLSYLFKVLSIQKALSIQVHPNKAEAERLHKARPDVYKDPNHKPELAIALTPFLALCGFRPYEQIHQFCTELPPLATLLGGSECCDALKNGTAADLRKCYEKLMTSADADITKCIENILAHHANVLIKHNLNDIFKTINRDFPLDVGLLSLFFLNLIKLQPGEAIFLAADEIHAYLSGDCIECMACSDNVVRAGLTPKYKDVAQLISCLNYVGSPAADKLFQPRRLDEHVQVFAPPVDDFAVVQVQLAPTVASYKLALKPSASILIVLEGERTIRVKGHTDIQLTRGKIVYIPRDAAALIEFTSSGKGNEDFIAYIAMSNTFKN